MRMRRKFHLGDEAYKAVASRVRWESSSIRGDHWVETKESLGKSTLTILCWLSCRKARLFEAGLEAVRKAR
jgi:hypothetical protein